MATRVQRLKALSGDRYRQRSIRINDRWLIRAVWKDGNELANEEYD